MTTARSISRVDSTVEMGIVNKVESDLVVYRDADKCYVLDQVRAEKKSCSYLYWLNSLSWCLNHNCYLKLVSIYLHQELTSNGARLKTKIEHEFVKDVIKYGKEEVFKKMMDRFVIWFRQGRNLSSHVGTFLDVLVFLFYLV